MEKISKHITYKEATQSPTATNKGIQNIPNPIELENMRLVAELVFEPLREWYAKPIRINSFFRNEALNKAVGGVKTSQHRFGKAIDIDAGSIAENKKLFDYIKDNLDFDQVINEHNFQWIHISYNKNKNRKQVLAIK
jgi:zinc D-Ala-D-Ala carboxypeptidase